MVVDLDKEGNPDPYFGTRMSTLLNGLAPASLETNRLAWLLG